MPSANEAGVGLSRAARPRSTAISTIKAPPMVNTIAVVWKGGSGPLRAVRLASVAHSTMAPTPSAVAVLGDMGSLGLRWGQTPCVQAGVQLRAGREGSDPARPLASGLT